jgi:hypothetical protein
LRSKSQADSALGLMFARLAELVLMLLERLVGVVADGIEVGFCNNRATKYKYNTECGV